MSTRVSRKNGKQASCEPCRKGKIRCDHQQPVCDRCRRRGVDSQCYYHPAPLSRSSRSSRLESTVAPVEQRTAFPVTSRNDRAPSTTIASDNSHSTNTVPDGPVLVSLPWHSLQSLDPKEPEPNFPSVNRDDRGNATYTGDMKNIVEVLSHLCHLPLIAKLVHEFYTVSQIALVPGPLILPIVSNLQNIYHQIQSTGSSDERTAKMTQVADSVLRASSGKVNITASMNASEFCSLNTGTNLRLETIGLVYTIAARSCLLGLARDDDKRQDFVQALFQCSALCIRLSREICAHMNDMIVWLAYENVRLTIKIQGYGNSNVWRRLGDLSTDVLALGINRESTLTKLPFFLAECRRRTFTAAYGMDIFLAVLFDRQPRILSRYSDCEMPLDLTDDQLFTTESFHDERLLFERARGGWSPNGSFSNSTWIRLRYGFARSSECIMEASARSSTVEQTGKLKDILTECHNTWQSLPTHLRYKHECWSSGYSALFCLMLGDVYLLYLQTQFHIHSLLEKDIPESSSMLLQVSAEMLATVLQLGSNRDRAVYIHNDFLSIILCSGLPSAVALTSALKGVGRSGSRSLPSNLGRASLIRNLSVFVSYLENICGPGDTSYPLCRQAYIVMSKALDEILEYPAAGSSAIQLPPQSAVMDQPNDADAFAPFNTIMHDTDSMLVGDFDLSGDNGIDLMNLSNWIGNVDWTGAGVDSTIF